MTTTALRRIALFAEQGHPLGDFRSGVSRLVGHLVAGCTKRDVRVDVFTYGRRPGADRHSGARYRVVVPRVCAEFHGLRVDALDIVPFPNRRFGRLDASTRYDAVVGTSPGIGTQGQLFARARGVPFLGIYTTDLPHYAASWVEQNLPRFAHHVGAPVARGFARTYLGWLYDRTRTRLVLAPTEQVRLDLLDFVDADVEILGRGSDTLRFPGTIAERRARAAGSRRPVALYVGRIDYGQKNLGALETLLRKVPEVDLWVVGGGEDLTRLRRRLAWASEEGRVSVFGRIDDAEELKRIYSEADLFVFPSIADTLGQVVLEAQAAGLPVVVRDRGGPKELVRDRVTGFVTESDEHLVSAARLLVLDAGVRLRMGAAARAHADSSPSWDDVAGRFVEYLRRAVGVGQPGSASVASASAAITT